LFQALIVGLKLPLALVAALKLLLALVTVPTLWDVRSKLSILQLAKGVSAWTQ